MVKKVEKKMLKVAILRATFLHGEPLEVGKNVTLEEKDALALITSGKAAAFDSLTEIDSQKIKTEKARLENKAKKKAALSPSEVAFGKEKLAEMPDAENGTGGETGDEQLTEKQLKKFNKEGLQKVLTEAGIEFDDEDTNAVLIEKILASYVTE